LAPPASTNDEDGRKISTQDIQWTYPTLDWSKEKVAYMENPEKQNHGLNQDYGVVPSVATSAL
jgi:hypothetical protein